MLAPAPLRCPISLDAPPLCAQITPCGHVFAFPAIMAHLAAHNDGASVRRAAPCPLCYAPVVARELRLVRVHQVAPPQARTWALFLYFTPTVGHMASHVQSMCRIAPCRMRRAMHQTADGSVLSICVDLLGRCASLPEAEMCVPCMLAGGQHADVQAAAPAAPQHHPHRGRA